MDGNKVKTTIMFRGRERRRGELGDRILDRLAAELKELAAVESRTRLEGNQMFQVFAPKKGIAEKIKAEKEEAPAAEAEAEA
jgi:translation initiation factor IF-3